MRAPLPLFGLWADPVLSLALLALWIALALVFNGEPEIDQWVSSLFFAAQPCAQGSQALACGSFPAAAKRRWRRSALLPLSAGRRRRRRRGDAGARSRRRPASRRRTRSSPHGRDRRLDRRPRPDRERLPQGILGPAAAGLDRPVRRRAAIRAGRRNGRTPVPSTAPSCRARHRRSSGSSASSRYGRNGCAARRRSALPQSLCFTAGLRVAFGGHYLSDVVLGGLSTLIVFAALAALVERVLRGVAQAPEARNLRTLAVLLKDARKSPGEIDEQVERREEGRARLFGRARHRRSS